MNLLSVAAAYGALVFVFQDVGPNILGFSKVETIESWLPLMLFAILFGLSMDYHVFLLSRIRESYDGSGDNAASVEHGLRSTANIITGAAAIMLVVFGGFALGQTVALQQMGFGLAVAVFLDATVVRIVLVPSAMELLGDWNWYLPQWLAWIPDLRVEGSRPAAGATGANARGRRWSLEQPDLNQLRDLLEGGLQLGDVDRGHILATAELCEICEPGRIDAGAQADSEEHITVTGGALRLILGVAFAATAAAGEVVIEARVVHFAVVVFARA